MPAGSDILSGVIVVLGTLSGLVFVAGGLYALNELRRRRRYGAALLLFAAAAALLTRVGLWLVCAAAGVVVLGQAACYAYFTLRTLLRGTGRSAAWQGSLPSVTIAIPAKNESAIIDETLLALDALDYPREQLEIVLIDDGSSDETAALARARQVKMRQRLRVLSHASSAGKAERLNELARSLDSRYLLVLDADHWVEADLLRRLLGGFSLGPQVACVQAASAVRNSGENLLTKLLDMECLFRYRGIYPGKPLGIFLGSGGMFERQALLDVGGFDRSMLTEDAEISYRLYEHGRRIVYDDGSCTHDLAPGDFKNFFNQRYRWMRGLWQAMLIHAERRRRGQLTRGTLAHFVQFTFDGFGALCLCFLEAAFALRELGSWPLPAAVAWPVYTLLSSCALAFTVGSLRGRRPLNLLFLPLVPLYIVLHTVPMIWALIDSYVLDRPLLWVKTERAARAASEPLAENPSRPLASGGV